MHSAIYFGRVHHRRFWPRSHAFGRGLYMALLDLDELDQLEQRVPGFSVDRPNLLSWWRRDHLGQGDLKHAVYDSVQAELGFRPQGPVRVLTQLRVLGYLMNPACLYFCYDRDGEHLVAVVIEVENTPWRQRGRYVVAPQSDALVHFGAAERVLHLSSFVQSRSYVARLTKPTDRLRLHVNVCEGAEVELAAGLTMQRMPFSARALWRMQWRYPLMPQMIALGTFIHSCILLWKGVAICRNGSDRRYRWLERWIQKEYASP